MYSKCKNKKSSKNNSKNTSKTDTNISIHENEEISSETQNNNESENSSTNKSKTKKARRSRLIIDNEEDTIQTYHPRINKTESEKIQEALENAISYNKSLLNKRYELNIQFLKKKVAQNFSREDKSEIFFNVPFYPKEEIFSYYQLAKNNKPPIFTNKQQNINSNTTNNTNTKINSETNKNTSNVKSNNINMNNNNIQLLQKTKDSNSMKQMAKLDSSLNNDFSPLIDTKDNNSSTTIKSSTTRHLVFGLERGPIKVSSGNIFKSSKIDLSGGKKPNSNSNNSKKEINNKNGNNSVIEIKDDDSDDDSSKKRQKSREERKKETMLKLARSYKENKEKLKANVGEEKFYILEKILINKQLI